MPKPNRVRYSRHGAKDLDHMRLRRKLLDLFLELAQRQGLAYYTIARVCATSEPRAWRLLHGHIELFNSETLIDILARFGVTVDVVVTKQVRVRYFAKDFK